MRIILWENAVEEAESSLDGHLTLSESPRHRPLQHAVIVVRNFLSITGGLLLCILFTPLVPWSERVIAMPWTSVDRGVLIVLSGTSVEYSDPASRRMIGLNTYWRVVHAIYAWRNGHFQKILVSGIESDQTIKPLLIANGIPESAVLVENRSANTRENAFFSKPILASFPGPYVLLSSDYHMYRASRCFARANISVETLPVPDLAKRCDVKLQRWDAFCQLAGEFSSIAYYRLRGWI